jgi:excisionase family DNA binding protein
MNVQVSPKQLARAIQVSESSIKRWCDQGAIATVRTAGGHRRIDMTDVMRFLRENRYALVRPEVLGLPATTGRTAWVLERAESGFREALLVGDEDRARQILFDLYLAKHELTTILDGVVTAALHGIGDRWSCGEAEVYQERRGCEICLRLLHELRMLTPPIVVPRGLAMGGTPEGDMYLIPNAMVDLVLRHTGWETIALGAGLPFNTIRAAILEHRPQLFWLSVSYIRDEAEFLARWNELCAAVPLGVTLVAGGQALTETLREQIPRATFCGNLTELEALASSLGEASFNRS